MSHRTKPSKSRATPKTQKPALTRPVVYDLDAAPYWRAVLQPNNNEGHAIYIVVTYTVQSALAEEVYSADCSLPPHVAPYVPPVGADSMYYVATNADGVYAQQQPLGKGGGKHKKKTPPELHSNGPFEVKVTLTYSAA